MVRILPIDANLGVFQIFTSTGLLGRFPAILVQVAVKTKKFIQDWNSIERTFQSYVVYDLTKRFFDISSILFSKTCMLYVWLKAATVQDDASF